jgi:hypothetical protein
MTILKGNRAHHAFLKKGFRDERGRKDIFYYFYYQGKKTHIFTKMSHNPGDLNEWLISQMAHQLKLSKNDLVEVVKCTIDGDKLVRIYLTKKELP